MVIAVVAAFALVVVGVVVAVVRYLNLRAERRTEAVLRRVDTHLETISTSVAQAVDRIVAARGAAPQLLPTLDFDALVETLLTEAAARTGADAVVLKVQGPGHQPVVASFGEGVDGELLERVFEPPDGRAFQAATVEWTYPPVDGLDAAPFRSALFAPLDASDHALGAVAVFSTSHDAFRADQAGALRALVEEAEVALSNARRFAEVEAQAFLDPAAGIPDRRGYELALGRAVARARRTGAPLTVAIVALEEGARSGLRAAGIGELARLVARMTRGSDVSCRRGGSELAILLPETSEPDATRLTARLREEARRSLGRSGQATFAVGLAEWRPDESVEALDARATAALSRPLAAVSPGRTSVSRPRTSSASEPEHVVRQVERTENGGLRKDAVEGLALKMGEGQTEHELTLVALDVVGLDDLADHLGRDVADAAFAELARQLDGHVGDGSVHRIDRTTFALVLVGSTSDAETMLGTLQAAVGSGESEYAIALNAGVTGIVEGDVADDALRRAEHALWQATQAGPGTVVVALQGARPPRSS